MANIPDLRSQEQITGQIVDSFLARLGKDIDLNKGSFISQLIEAFGRNMFKSTADIITMIDALSIDRAEGESLQRLARDRNVPILPALPSTGKVTVTDKSFEKISSTVYAGQPAPVAGSLKIYVSDASNMPVIGSIYIGRGTKNIEGPLEYTSKTSESGGAYWSLTLSSTSPTTKFHNVGESVILAQGGNRIVNVGTTVQTAQGSAVSAVTFSTTSAATIFDGETTVTDVPVKCRQLGSIGNVPRGAIKDAIGLPFISSVTNDFAFSNGRESDTDDDIRTRVKAYEQAKAKGTEQAIQYATIGVFAKDELKKVKSSAVVRYTDNSSAVIFDDGSGYEPNYLGATYEVVVDSAVGGEKEIQLRQKPLAQARVESVNAGPYVIEDGSYIACVINNEYSEHLFQASDFKVVNSATVEEVTASINGDVNCAFLCSTAENGTKIVLYPKDRTANNIRVVTPSNNKSNANDILGLSTAEEVTLRLYKNDIPLFQDGLYAKVSTLPKSEWGVVVQGEDITYIVDGTTEVTVQFLDSHFKAVDVNSSASSLTDIETWAAVMTNLMPGVTAKVVGDYIDLVSNKLNDDSASIEITGGTLRNLIFSVEETLYQNGRTPDFTLNKQTGQIALKTPLEPKDKLTAGSQSTRANVMTSSLPTGSGSAGRFWTILDGDARSIQNTLKPTTKLTFSKTGTKLTLTATSPALIAEGFDDVQKGDWLLVWANSSDNAALISNQGFWRVESANLGELIVDDGVTTRSNLLTQFNSISSRIVIVRSSAPIQLVEYPVATLTNLQQDIADQLEGAEVEIVGSKLRISTKTYGETGQIYIAAADAGGEALGLTLATPLSNVTSHYAFISQSAEASVNSFSHGTLGEALAENQFNDLIYENMGGTGDDMLTILPKHDIANNTLLPESNEKRLAFVSDFTKESNTLYRLSLKLPEYLKTGRSLIQEGDRYYLRSAYKFDSRDNATMIIDGDITTKAFTLPVARKLTVSSHSTPTQNGFSADDAESSLDLKDSASFAGFDFTNFKIHRQASKVLTDGTYAVRFKSAEYGPVGNTMRVGFSYPSSNDQLDISHNFGQSDVIDVQIVLPVKNPKDPFWDHTSSFIVEVLSTVGGKDTVKYTWKSGTGPDFSAIQEGDILMLSDLANFLPENKGFSARIKEISTDYLIVEMPTGKAVTDNLACTSIVNSNGIVTLTLPSGHNIQKDQRIGLWNTSSHDGVTYPFQESYIVKNVTGNNVELTTPSSVPSGDIQNVSGANNIVTVTTKNPHNLSAGNVIKIRDVDSGINGIHSVFAISSTSPYIFKFMKNGYTTETVGQGGFDYQSYMNSGTSKTISTISKNGYTVTVNATSHGLSANDLVKVEGVTLSEWNSIANDWNSWTHYTIGTVVKKSNVDYFCKVNNDGQDPSTSPAMWSVITGWYTASNWSSANSYVIGDVVRKDNLSYYCKIANTNVVPASDPTKWIQVNVLYSVSDVIRRTTGPTHQDYVCKVANSGIDPISDFVKWAAVDSMDLTGTFTVESAGLTANSFTYTYAYSGLTSGTGGTVSKQVPTASVARSLGAALTNNMQIGTVETTVQQVIDYCAANISDKISAELASGLATSPINASTADTLGLSSDYIDTTASAIRTTKGNRQVSLVTASLLIKGSTIDITGITSPNTSYNGSYTVVDSYVNPLVPTENIAVIQTTVKASITTELTVSATIKGTTPMIMLEDGENAVASNSLDALTNNPMFAVKTSWKSAPTIGEELRLVVKNNDHINRFWNRLVVTGLANIAKVDLSKYSTELQLTTRLFGGKGSIQVVGGTANTLTLALSSAGKIYNSKFGQIQVPYEIRKGLVSGQWINIKNTIKNNKRMGFDTSTSIKLTGTTIQIMSGSGTFQTIRPTTHTLATKVKFEKQGNFIAIIAVDGPNFGSSDAGIQEGDWVRISNEAGLDTSGSADGSWSSSTSYGLNSRVKYGNDYYISLSASNLSNNPEGTPAKWKLSQISANNEGIYQVVRTFGDDTIYVEISNPIEEMVDLGHADAITVYSYDSIMPNDKLLISTDIFGADNIGSYTVADFDISSSNITSTIVTLNDVIPNPPSGSITLGGNYDQINFEASEMISLWKHIFSMGPSNNNELNILLDSPELSDRVGETFGSYLQGKSKLEFPETINVGVDAYNYYKGLLKELNKVIYGDASDPTTYPGVRAAGTYIDIREAILKRIKTSFVVRIKTGIPFTEVRERIKAAVAGYVNNLAVGESVSISRMVAAANSVTGVIAVAVTYPTYDASNDLIAVAADERAFILDPTSDITVSVIE